ncbi:MAG: hypothetical protein HKL95_07880 [Phycisphaerae bacterium]|nr:hypothetical protein [Phycisphaerae bacterium]
MSTLFKSILNSRSPRARRVASAAVAGMIGWAMGHSAAVRAVILASDNAANPAYSGGTWSGTSNGGTGFSQWFQGPTGSGVNQAATWAFTTQTASTVFGTYVTPNIDTSGVSWSMGAYSGTSSDPAAPYAYRGLNTPLQVGQTLQLSMATGYMSNPGQEGFQIQNFNSTTGYGTPLFQIAAAGSGSYYAISYGGYTSPTTGFAYSQLTKIASAHTGVTSPNNGNGITVAFTLESPTSFDLTVTPLADPSAAETFNNLTLTDLPVNQLFLYNDNLGLTSQLAYFNNLEVTATPEPTAAALLLSPLLLLGLIPRRKSAARAGQFDRRSI